jgi:hypothetical protein
VITSSTWLSARTAADLPHPPNGVSAVLIQLAAALRFHATVAGPDQLNRSGVQPVVPNTG